MNDDLIIKDQNSFLIKINNHIQIIVNKASIFMKYVNERKECTCCGTKIPNGSSENNCNNYLHVFHVSKKYVKKKTCSIPEQLKILKNKTNNHLYHDTVSAAHELSTQNGRPTDCMLPNFTPQLHQTQNKYATHRSI